MKTVLILGATSNIGIAIARRFAEAGNQIQLAARDTAVIGPSASDISIRYNVHCSIYRFDAAQTADHASFFKSLDPIPDTCIYVIGYMGEGDILENWKETEKIIDSNYRGAVSILNLFAGYYGRQKKGTIIGISSVAGERGRQSNPVYGSAKAGFNAYLSGLRNLLWSSGVHVLTVKPGFVDTKMTEGLNLPPLLTASPSRVAEAVYLSAEKKKNVVYVKWIWRWIMLMIKMIPESVFKKLKL